MDDLKKQMANVIDHTFLKTEHEGFNLEKQREKIKKLVQQSNEFKAFSVCVRENMVAWAKELGAQKICSVIGFPVGDDFSTEQKIELLEQAKQAGACEFDMVINVKAIKSGKDQEAYDDIFELSKVCKDDVLKVIFENCYLSDDEKMRSYEIAKSAFIDSNYEKFRFFKTSTGFAKPKNAEAIGATLKDMKMMHLVSRGDFGLKAAGGVSDFDQAIEFWKACGSPINDQGLIDPYKFRIGSSSLLLSIFNEKNVKSTY